MQAVDRGLIGLDTPLVKYTPDRILTGDSHTGGLPNLRSGDSPLAIHFEPGAKWEYSGEGY